MRFDAAMVIRFADFELDEDAREVRRAGQVVSLEPKSFDTLRYLLVNRARVVTKTELLDAVWPDTFVTEASLTSCMNKIRQGLGAGNAELIKTYYRKGYRFVGDCSLSDSDRNAVTSATATPGRPAFVNRVTELEALNRCLQTARGGSGRLVLLAGEQGVGKSRIVERLRSAPDNADGPTILELVGRCQEGEAAPALLPWVQVVRGLIERTVAETLASILETAGGDIAALVPEVTVHLPGLRRTPPLSDPMQARLRLFESVTAVLRRAASQGPLLVIVEDLHWADLASLHLLEVLARDLPSMAALVLATYRDTDLAHNAGLQDTVTRLRALPGTQHLSLTGLPPAEVTAITHALAATELPGRMADFVFQQTGGNPFFVEHLVRHLIEAGELGDRESANAGTTAGTPEDVRLIVERRLRTLSRACQYTLSTAAVIGQEFDFGLLNRIRAIERGESLASTKQGVLTELQEAVEARILEATAGDTGRYRFCHALLRDVIYSQLGIAERSRCHWRVGEAIEMESGPYLPASIPDLADHFVRGANSGSSEKALDYVMRAAELARSNYAFDVAIRRYREALDLVESSEARDRALEASLIVSLAEVQWNAGDNAKARALAEQAGALAAELGDSELLARAALSCGSTIMAQATTDPSYVALLEQARAALPECDSQLRAKVLGRLAWAYHYANDHGVLRRQMSAEALQMAERLGQPTTLVWSLSERHRALIDPDHADERLPLANQQIRLAQEHADAEFLASGYNQRAWDLAERGQMAEADADMARFAAIADDLQMGVLRWTHVLWRTMRAIMSGRFPEAFALMEEGFALGKRIDEPFATVTYGTQLISLRVLQGKLEGLEQLVSQLVGIYPHLPALRLALAYVHVEEGKHDEARRDAEGCLGDGLEHLPWNATWLTTVSFLGMIYAAIGDRGRSEQVYRRLVPYADRTALLGVNAIICYGAVALPVAALATTLEAWDEAEQHFQAAMTLNSAMGARPWLAYTSYEHAVMLERRGRASDRGRAGQLRKQAAQLAHEMQIESLLRKL